MRVKNWDKFQHYKPKNPKFQKKMTWFKLYGADLLNNIDWHELSSAEKVALIEVWCLASESEGNLPSPKEIAFRLRRDVNEMTKLLNSIGGWLEEGSRDGIDEVYTPTILEKSIEEDKKHYVMTVQPEVIKAPVISSDLFEKWWGILPDKRKVNKKGCGEKWKSKKYDSIAKKIIDWTSTMRNSKAWKDGFNPAPETILNQERWNDTSFKQSAIPKGVV